MFISFQSLSRYTDGNSANSMICPKCRKNNARRTDRAGFLDNAVNALAIKPYSCPDCRRRFYALRPNISLAAIGEQWGQLFSRRGNRRIRRELNVYLWALLVIAILVYFLSRPRF
jgi:predicted nucleic-acid-binding Zn-ribbon protein